MAIRCMKYPRCKANHAENVKDEEVCDQNDSKSLQRSILNASKLFSLLFCQVDKKRVSANIRLVAEIRCCFRLRLCCVRASECVEGATTRPESIQRLGFFLLSNFGRICVWMLDAWSRKRGCLASISQDLGLVEGQMITQRR